MKNNIQKFLSSIVLAVVLTSTTVFAGTFTDLSLSHKNFSAITYLQENGILEGYSDGTFKPERAVNRAEFLKIITEGSNISTDVETKTPFTDVNHNDWYGKYVKKAYSEGWIEGYEDGTFRPNQTINKVEALKILAVVQKWQLADTLTENPFQDVARLSWYAKFVSYAKDNDFLEEKGSNFEPGQLMTRANISEIIFRTIEPSTEPTTPTSDPVTEPTTEPTTPAPAPVTEPVTEPTTTTNFKPVAYETISSTFFNDIQLDESLPNTFYENEIYILSGKVTSGNDNSATVFMEYTENGKTKYMVFNGKVNNENFEIPLFFNRPGNFYIGVIPGKNGSSNVTTISVLPSVPQNTNQTPPPEKAKFLDIEYANSKTFVEFSSNTSTFKKLTFVQGTKAATYYSRQNFAEMPVYYSDFENFNATTVSYYIETAHMSSVAPLIIDSEYTKSSTETFRATEHTFSEINATKITATPPDTLNSISPITFSGKLKYNAQKLAYVIKPDGFVETIELETASPTTTVHESTVIKSGGSFQYTYIPEEKGRYIVEVSDDEGIPIVNHPVYIGGEIPLIPDYDDLHQREFYTGTVDLSNQRQELLNEINKSRKEHGLKEVSLATDLSKAAQSHAEDMAANNYFSHVNTAGENPTDRAKKEGVTTPVSENIARDVSIEFGHFGLMRSASHRENILDSNWTEVGLGIALADGYLYIAEEFSYAPLTADDLSAFKAELLGEINQLRTDASLPQFIYSTALETASAYMNDKVIDEGQTVNNTLFAAALESVNVTGSSQAIGRVDDSWKIIKTSIITEETSQILNQNLDTIGIDIQIDNSGGIHTTLILNHQQQ